MDPLRRVVYVATGEKHILEAVESMRTLWRYNPGTRVVLYVDATGRQLLNGPDGHSLMHPDLVDVIEHPNPTFSPLDKSWALCESDFAQVLYLDTDTWIAGGIAQIFELLDVFDLAVAHDAVRLGKRQPHSLVERAPITFPELNTGVIAFRRGPAVDEFLDQWRLIHREVLDTGSGWVGDQGSFRVALFHSEVRFTILTPEYNCHIAHPTSLNGPVRILHGRWPHHPALIERNINRTHDPRAFIPGLGTLKRFPRLIRWRRRYHALRRQGLLQLLRKRIRRRNPLQRSRRSE